MRWVWPRCCWKPKGPLTSQERVILGSAQKGERVIPTWRKTATVITAANLRRLIPASAVATVLAFSWLGPSPSLASSAGAGYNCDVKGISLSRPRQRSARTVHFQAKAMALLNSESASRHHPRPPRTPQSPGAMKELRPRTTPLQETVEHIWPEPWAQQWLSQTSRLCSERG